MSLYQIELDDSKIMDQVSGIIASCVNRELKSKYSVSGKEVSQFVREMVYAHKDEIIERIVDRASKELVKRGLPKLIERFGGSE